MRKKDYKRSKVSKKERNRRTKQWHESYDAKYALSAFYLKQLSTYPVIG